MNFLLDTHLLVWTTAQSGKLSDAARRIISDPGNRLYFSVVSVWEVAIKRGLRRPQFTIEPHILRRELIDRGYIELPVIGTHTLAIGNLPLLHKDPFDRMLVAQALTEGITLLTVDAVLAQYPCPVRLV
jgi:PIN domain nuclease of toxin-antitoxin system